jgi:hypothetical protein
MKRVAKALDKIKKAKRAIGQGLLTTNTKSIKKALGRIKKAKKTIGSCIDHGRPVVYR